MEKIAASISHRTEDGILYVTVTGSVKLADIAAYAAKHKVWWASSPRLLWDVREMRFFDVSAEGLSVLVDSLTEVGNLRSGWRTALVVPPKESLLGKLILDISAARDGVVDVGLFTTMDEARNWLQSA